MQHEPVAERLLAHLRGHYGIDAVAATKLSVHTPYVFRVDRGDGDPWVARAFPPSRPNAGVEGDAAILRFLERQNYPAERLAILDPGRGAALPVACGPQVVEHHLQHFAVEFPELDPQSSR